MTRPVYEFCGYLFGQYDGRGGTIFIEAGSEAEAIEAYLGRTNPDGTDEAAGDDLLGPAVIQTGCVLDDGADLDGEFTGGVGRLWVFLQDGPYQNPDGMPLGELPFTIPWLEPLRIKYREDGSRPDGKYFSGIRWDDDCFGLVFYPWRGLCPA